MGPIWFSLESTTTCLFNYKSAHGMSDKNNGRLFVVSTHIFEILNILTLRLSFKYGEFLISSRRDCPKSCTFKMLGFVLAQSESYPKL